MAKNDNAWTRSLSRINLKIIFLQNYQFFMNHAKGPVKIHWLEAEKITFDPWRNFRIASLQQKHIKTELQNNAKHEESYQPTQQQDPQSREPSQWYGWLHISL